eukprot:358018-Chlamydomonas_euryale.AAC.2
MEEVCVWLKQLAWSNRGHQRADSVASAGKARCNIHVAPGQPDTVHNAGTEITCRCEVSRSCGQHSSTAGLHGDL